MGLIFLNVDVPSREKGRDNYVVELEHVAGEFDIVDDLRSMHECGAKKHGMGHGIHNKARLRVDAFCAHDFAAYMLLRDCRLRDGEDFNYSESSLLAIPSEKVIAFYDKLNSNCLIRPPGKDKARKLNVAEKEISLFGYVGKFGFEESFCLMR